MARINVEQTALTDSRFVVLGVSLGAPESLARACGLGVMVAVWNEAQEREAYFLSDAALIAIVGNKDAPQLLEGAELTERCGKKGNRIRGAEGRIEWLKRQREHGRRGGKLGGRPSPNKPIGVKDTITPTGKGGQTPPAPAPSPALTLVGSVENLELGSTREHARARVSTTHFEFPTPDGGTCTVPADELAALESIHGPRGIDVHAEIAKAAAWVATDPDTRARTPDRLPVFLADWLHRAKPVGANGRALTVHEQNAEAVRQFKLKHCPEEA